MQLAGTVFFVSYSVDEGISTLYAVTAKHVVEEIRKHGDGQYGYYRINVKDGPTKWVQFSLGDCSFHPDDPAVDIALVPSVGIEDKFDVMYYPMAAVLTDEVIARDQVGPGDEVFITGLFVNHYGKDRNIPIIRTGNIATMLEEKINTSVGLMDAYLIEARSIGGLSGSPAFVHLGVVRSFAGQVKHSNAPYGAFYLMGLMHGHFDVAVTDPHAADVIAMRERINMGIAIVVPVSKIIEVIEQPMLKQKRAGELAKFKAENLPVPDVVTPESSSEFTEADFLDALKKVSRKQSAPGKSET